MSNNVKVVVKLRPRSDKEVIAHLKEPWTIVGHSIKSPSNSFKFDHIFSSSSSNTDVFVGVIQPMVESCKNGFNTTIFTYGEKASGKTYTMDGIEEDPGIRILAIVHLFKENQSQNNSRQFIIRVGYVEIYNEMIYDLLNRRQNVHFEHNSTQMSNTEVIVKDLVTLLKLLQKGNNAKTPTIGNKRSTSHTIFQIIIESQIDENGPVQVSHLNFVDLDRSEGALIKAECGTCTDESMKYFCEAIVELGKEETFGRYSKSRLTRMLKSTLSGNANIVIICNVNPTVLNETTNTLNFAEEAQKAKIWPKCSKVRSKDTIMKKVRDELAKIRTQPPSDSTNFYDKLAELESIILMGKIKQSKRDNATKRYAMEVLKIRPFIVDGLAGLGKKYQIGEMDGKCMDSQSRAQRKYMIFKWSDYYLERVGFEINMKMRRNLKYGNNLVGRSDINDDISICIDSAECSRKHCIITVADDESVSLTDLNSSNGTTINGVFNKGQTVTLREGDVIAIVSKGKTELSSFVGNFDCTVYRLRRFATETLLTYDLIEDDGDSSVIVLSDDDSTDQDDTCYIPMEMEVDLSLPSASIEVQTPTEGQMIAESMEQNQLDKDVSTTSGDLLSDEGFAGFDSDHEILNDLSTFEDLGDIIGSHIAEVETSNLGNLARELAMLASDPELDMPPSDPTENVSLSQQFDQLNRAHANDEKLLSEEREVTKLKTIQMTEENSKLMRETKWLELQLAALAKEKNDLLAENLKLREIQNGCCK